jgi:hypothetical protein
MLPIFNIVYYVSKPPSSKFSFRGGESSMKLNIIELKVSVGRISKVDMAISVEKKSFALKGRFRLRRGILTISCRVFMRAQRNYIETLL